MNPACPHHGPPSEMEPDHRLMAQVLAAEIYQRARKILGLGPPQPGITYQIKVAAFKAAFRQARQELARDSRFN